MKKGGICCVFSIMVGLLHQSTCCGKELARKFLIFSRSGMIFKSSPPGNFFLVIIAIWTEFILSQHFWHIMPTNPSHSGFLVFFFLLFIYTFICLFKKQSMNIYWVSYMGEILDLYLGYKMVIHIVKSYGGVWFMIYSEWPCIHSSGLNLHGNWPEVAFPK